MTSLPSGVPLRLTPSVKELPLADILLGVALARVALPPPITREKSLASIAPEPEDELYTASLKTTSIVELSVATVDDVIVEDVPS